MVIGSVRLRSGAFATTRKLTVSVFASAGGVTESDEVARLVRADHGGGNLAAVARQLPVSSLAGSPSTEKLHALRRKIGVLQGER